MGKRGAPVGNQNAVGGKQKLFDAALRRAIAQDSADRVRAAAESLLNQAANGEQWAIKELGDRLDGKVAQALNIGGQDGENPIQTKWTIEIIEPKAK